MAIYICGKEATPKELAQFVPSRDHEQIRKYIDRLKVSGDYETFVQGVEDFALDNEPFGKFPEGTRDGQFTLKAFVEDYYCILNFQHKQVS